MKCPFCDYEESKVVDSRPVEDGTMIRRRRECMKCSKRFTTYERVENIPLIVVKKGGQRVAFDKNKLLGGMIKACEKRPVPIETIQRTVDALEKKLYQVEEKEVESAYIGECVMDALKSIDQVAYVRFASVYREFKDVESFLDELNALLSERSNGDNF
ncbi:MAG: transcriptional regulator NrdR [Eubacterium sp.]|nr:transcriptional regulator NrdR [Eubacterium sp.]